MTEPERVLVVYDDDVLVAVLRRAGGPIHAAGDGDAPLLQHAALSGRFATVRRADEVVAALRAAADVDGVIERLRDDGFDVRPTPRSAVRTLL